MIMTHPGLPLLWAYAIVFIMVIVVVWATITAVPNNPISAKLSLANLPLLGGTFRYLSRHVWVLLLLKIIFALVFLLIIVAGIWGTPIVERNLATSLTWNLWWTGIIIAIVVSGSAWCAVCPWDNIASWLVNQRLWRRSSSHSRLNLSVPTILRSVWPASILFISFTWLELGVGIVSSPYATAIMAVAMVVLATTTLALFENKAFCRYMCPVGRTVGAYSQLAPIALRPIDPEVCNNCKTLECYHGSDKIAPCPTKLMMGRLVENTYCTSCGNCSQSCPSQNISWQLRSPSSEAIQDARPHLDEAFFMMILLSLTMFHGLTMLDGWQNFLTAMAQQINDSGQLIISFSIGLGASLILPIAVYAVCIFATRKLSLNDAKLSYRKLFSGFAFSALPLAFSYHIAHNLNHFVRESSDWLALLNNPLGVDSQPLSMMEKHMRHMDMMLPESVLFAVQAVIIIIGFLIAVQVIRHRGYRLFAATGRQLVPLLMFTCLITGFNVWMMVQPMTMRM